MPSPPTPPTAPRRPIPAPAVVALVAAVVVLDRATKIWAVAFLPEGRRLSFLGDVFRLELLRNPGAFLGLGGGLPEGVRAAIFTWGVAALTLGALVVAFRRGVAARTALGAALVGAGGLGNLWDRIAEGGHVIDFLNLGVGPLRTGIFNVADMAITAGVILLLLPAGRPPRD